MDILEDTVMKLVAQGEIPKGIISIGDGIQHDKIMMSNQFIKRKIPSKRKQEVYTHLTNLGLEYAIHNQSYTMPSIIQRNSTIRRDIEKEEVHFAKTNDLLSSNDYITTKDINRILSTEYLKERPYLRDLIKPTNGSHSF